MKKEQIISTSRLEVLLDSIFGFSMTILVIFIDVPSEKHLGDMGQLYGYFAGQYQQFTSYLITFLLLAGFWVIHHQLFHYVKKTDYIYLWMNIFLMLLIVLLPFGSILLGDQANLWGTYFICIANLFFITNIMLLMWLYASRNKRLIASNTSSDVIKATTNQLLIFSSISFLSILISFLYIPAGLFIYFLIPLIAFFYARR